MLFTKKWAGCGETIGLLWYSEASDSMVTTLGPEGARTECGSPKLDGESHREGHLERK